MDYKAAWQYLDDLQFFKIKLGLESMAAFLTRMGNPQEQLSFVQVAGTNGKGSVAMNLLTILAGAGYRVGLFTSPHLSSVRERFRINDDFIRPAAFAHHATQIRDMLGDEQITYFEFTTALALLWFVDEAVDLVILEVGLGGRLDATNVVTPLVGVITNVSMDHEAYLGDTLTQVATEKAGIIKKGVPLVSGVAADVSRQVVSDRCAELGAPLWLLGRDFHHEAVGDGWRYVGPDRTIGQLPQALRGDYQKDNSSLALAVLQRLVPHGYRVDDEIIRQQLHKIRWPGRLESFWHDEAGNKVGDYPQGRYHYLLDGAHNPAGMASLVAALSAEFTYERLICVWAAMADKDLVTTLATISPLCDLLILTRPESDRAASLPEMTAALGQDFSGEIALRGEVAAALALAKEAARPQDLILVAGSLYLVGAARQLLLGELVDG